MAEATPRIHAEYLGNFVGQNVRILGKVTSLRGEQATIEAHGSVICVLNRVKYAPVLILCFAILSNPPKLKHPSTLLLLSSHALTGGPSIKCHLKIFAD